MLVGKEWLGCAGNWGFARKSKGDEGQLMSIDLEEEDTEEKKGSVRGTAKDLTTSPTPSACRQHESGDCLCAPTSSTLSCLTGVLALAR